MGVHPNQFQVCFKDKKYVSRVEKEWTGHYRTSLGYDGIDGQQRNQNLSHDVVQEEVKGINGAIKLNTYRRLGRHTHDTPCLILSVPDKKSRKFHVRLAAPFQNEEHWLSPDKYQIVYRNKNSVSWVERQWVNYHEQPLGYDSIELKQQRREFI